MEDIILLLIWTCGLSLTLAIGCWIADLVDRINHDDLFDPEYNPQARRTKGLEPPARATRPHE